MKAGELLSSGGAPSAKSRCNEKDCSNPIFDSQAVCCKAPRLRQNGRQGRNYWEDFLRRRYAWNSGSIKVHSTGGAP